MAEELEQTADERLGQEFWTQPEAAFRNEAMQLIYGNLVAVLRDEVTQSHGSVIDLMISERAAFMYSYMRDREARTGPGEGMADRNRREMNKDLIDLLLTIKKLWIADTTKDAGERVLAKVNKAIFEVLNDLPVDTGNKLKQELAYTFDKHGI